MVLAPKAEPASPSKSPRGKDLRVESDGSAGDGRKNFGAIADLLKRFRRGIQAWKRIQIGSQGYYSVERLLAFRDYHQRTSPVRAICVCLLSPLPPFVAMLLLDCIPLKDPAAGWEANWELWIRMLLSSFLVAGGLAFQAKGVIMEGAISNARTIGSAAMTAICYTGTSVAVASTWRFPIPFGIVLMVTPFMTFVLAFFLLNIGPRLLISSATLRAQLMAHLLTLSTHAILGVAYPTYSAIFTQLSGPQQTIFVFFLPVIKFGIKQLMARVSSTIHECIGPAIVFSVDVFNVLYLAICMQTADNSLTTILVIGVDACQIALALRSIHYNTVAIQNHSECSDLTQSMCDSPDYLGKITLMTREVFDKPRRLNGLCNGHIRVFAPFKLLVSAESMSFLDELASGMLAEVTGFSEPRSDATDTSYADPPGAAWFNSIIPVGPREWEEAGAYTEERSRLQNSTPPVYNKHKCHQVVPEEPLFDPTLGSASTIRLASIKALGMGILQATADTSSRWRSAVISRSVSLTNMLRSIATQPRGTHPTKTVEETTEEALQALFHCEYVVTSEYIECVIPLLYALYLLLLMQMPTAIYYPHTKYISSSNLASTLSHLGIYGGLEFLSFVGLHVMLKRRFGYSPVYQLAFVLESQMQVVQGLLFAWIGYILQLTLVHYGTIAWSDGVKRFPSSRTCLK